MLKLYFNTSFEGKEVLVGFEVGSAKKKKNAFKGGQAKKYWAGGRGGWRKVAKKLPSSFYSDGIYNNAKNLPECRKRAFLMSRKCRFPAEACPRTPFFTMLQTAILPHRNDETLAITTTTSTTVAVLFVQPPKWSLTLNWGSFGGLYRMLIVYCSLLYIAWCLSSIVSVVAY